MKYSSQPVTCLLSFPCQLVIRSIQQSGNMPKCYQRCKFCFSFVASSPLLCFFCLRFVIWLLVPHGWLACADCVLPCLELGSTSSSTFMLCDWASLYACSSPVPTRCAACLLFMSACKATSAEANGMGALPGSTVNNTFGMNLQSFKGIAGLLGSRAQCWLGAPECWLWSRSVALSVLWHSLCWGVGGGV